MSESDSSQYRERDSASLLVMGAFFFVIGTLVAIGPFWAPGFTVPQIVNVVAAGILIVLGAVMVLAGRRWRRRIPPPAGDEGSGKSA